MIGIIGYIIGVAFEGWEKLRRVAGVSCEGNCWFECSCFVTRFVDTFYVGRMTSM